MADPISTTHDPPRPRTSSRRACSSAPRRRSSPSPRPPWRSPSIDLGRLNIVVALGVATVKATLVALFFMHLKYGQRFYVAVLAGAALFAALMVGFVLLDSTLYQPDVRAHEAASRPAAPAR